MTPILTIDDASQLESSESFPDVEFVARLSEAAAGPVTLTVRTLDGTATEGIDFFAESKQVIIPAGTVEQTVIVDADSDSAVEGDESFFLELTNLSGAVLPDGLLSTRALGIIEDDDGDSRPALFVKDVRIVEGNTAGRAAEFEIALSRGLAAPVAIPFQTVGVTAEAGADFTPQSGTVNFGAFDTTATVTVPIVSDAVLETTERFDLVLDPSALDLASPIASAVGTATILDDDSGGGFLPVLSIEGARVLESSASFPDLEFTLSLSAPASSDVTYTARTIGASATESIDFFTEFSDVTIPAGQTTATFVVDADSDSAVEGDENLFLEITNVTGAIPAGGAPLLRALGIVLDDDGDSRPALFVGDVDVIERDTGTREALFEIALSRAFDTPVSIPFQTAATGATAGSDFTPLTGTVEFLPGQTEASVAVTVLSDTTVEASERFDLVLDTAGLDLAGGASEAVGTATILDDDAGGGALPVLTVFPAEVLESSTSFPDLEFRLALSAPSPSDITFDLRTDNGTAVEGIDFFSEFETVTIPAGQTTAVFTVDADSDTLLEGDESVSLEITNLAGAVLDGGALSLRSAGMIRDDDGDARPAIIVEDATVTEGDAGTREVQIDVSLSRASPTPITVGYTTAPGAGADAGDVRGTSGMLTFLPGQTRQTVAFDVIGDTDPEPTGFVDLILSRPQGADFSEGGSGTSGTVTILDDDAGVGGQPVLSVSDAAQFESAASFPDLEFVVSLSEPAPNDVTFDIDTDGDTATEGTDFFAESRSVTIPAGESSAVVIVEADSDTIPEPDETFFLDISNVSGAALEGGASMLRATGTILDDDSGAAVLPALIVEDVSVAEPAAGQTTATFTIASPVPAGLAIQGDFEVIGGTALPGSDFVAQSGSFTIPGGSFTTTVSVPILADTVAEGDETLVLRLSDIRNAGSGNRAGEVFAIGTITDSTGSAPQLSLSAVDADKPEGDQFETPFSFRLDRSGDFGTAFSVDFAVTGSGADPAEPEDFPGGVFPSGTIDIGASTSVQGFTVPVAVDDTVEGDEGFTLTLSNPTNGAVITQATATGTIRDDDGAGPPNAPPLASADRAATDPGTPVTVDVLANDTDPEGGPLTIVSAGAAAGRAPANGTVAVVGDSLRYTPDPGFSGIDVFDYRVEDGAGGAATASVGVRVGPLDLQSGVTRGTPAADTLLIAQNSAYVGVAGPDAFLFSDAAAANAVSRVDGAPDDLLQVIDGVALAGFEVRPDSLLLDLETGAQLRISQASLIGFEVGANPTVSDPGTRTDFAGFVGGVLGAEVPVTGIVTGGPTIIDEALIA